MSTPNPLAPIEAAAIPTAIAILQAAKQLLANLGTDPLQVVAKAPGAFQVFLGTVQLQFPALATAELGAAAAGINTEFDNLITKLQAVKP